MTYGAWEIVGRKDQELPIGTTLGNALRELIGRRFASNAAKQIERRWDIDPKTAKNVVQRGNVSERTLTKAVLAEKWDLWMALGEEVIGEKYEAWKEQELTKIIQGAERELTNIRRIREADAAVSRRALDLNAVPVLDTDRGDAAPRVGTRRETQSRTS